MAAAASAAAPVSSRRRPIIGAERYHGPVGLAMHPAAALDADLLLDRSIRSDSAPRRSDIGGTNTSVGAFAVSRLF
jgi:hypothetical protein